MGKNDLIEQYIAVYKDLHGHIQGIQREDLESLSQKQLKKEIWDMKRLVYENGAKRA